MKNRLNRRNFILKSSFTGVGLTLGIPYLLNSCNTQTKKDKSIIQESSISNSDISAIPKRKLGSLEVFPVGIGCMNAAWGFGDPMTKTAAAKLFREAADYGQNFFDTAEAYGAWLREEMVGEALAPIRKEVIIATKFGFAINDQGNITGLNSHPNNIRKAT